MAKFDEKGREIPDPRPVAMPVGFERPLSIQEEMMRFIRSPAFHQQMQEMAGEEVESFEEADDFDIGDSDIEDFPTAYEMSDDQQYQPLAESRPRPRKQPEAPPAREGGGNSPPNPPDDPPT